MHQTLRSPKSQTINFTDGSSSKTTTSKQVATSHGTLSRSLTKKISRTFSIRKPSLNTKTSSASSVSSDSGSETLISPPSTPSSASRTEFFTSTVESQASSQAGGSRPASSTSLASTYDIGYGSGRYAVNLESIYAQEAEIEMPGLEDDQYLKVKGLHKFSVQDYLSLL